MSSFICRRLHPSDTECRHTFSAKHLDSVSLWKGTGRGPTCIREVGAVVQAELLQVGQAPGEGHQAGIPHAAAVTEVQSQQGGEAGQAGDALICDAPTPAPGPHDLTCCPQQHCMYCLTCPVPYIAWQHQKMSVHAPLQHLCHAARLCSGR